MEESFYTKLIAEYTEFEGYWFGYDPSGWHSNSVLIKLNKQEYVHVSIKIVRYTISDDEIVDYVAYLGNSDVPYPVLFGEKYLYSEECGHMRRIARSKLTGKVDVDNAVCIVDVVNGNSPRSDQNKMLTADLSEDPRESCETFSENMDSDIFKMNTIHNRRMASWNDSETDE